MSIARFENARIVEGWDSDGRMSMARHPGAG
jgi:hypothetical protein